MSESVIFTNPTIIIISLIAVIFVIGAIFISNKYICAGLYICSFLGVVGCSIYALLLGIELNELLAYVSAFALLGLTAFLSPAENKRVLSDKTDENKPTESAEADNKEIVICDSAEKENTDEL